MSTKISENRWLTLGGLLMALSVIIGAFGAHGLSSVVTTERLITFDTAVKYQLYHSLGILFISLLMALKPALIRQWQWISALMLLGIVLFSGSLYALVLLDIPKLGMITPLGGFSWIIAWLWFAAIAWKS
jgi:uncharacterized membrane protein YgdD (TMEM256/DUF423 family)